MNRLSTLAAGLIGALVVSAAALAQTPPVPEQPLASRQVLPLWPGKPPGTQSALKEGSIQVPNTNLHILRNVTLPTLTVFLPKSGNPSKTAVIIAPGGGFRVLAIDQEGYWVADWFAQHGIAAFVLKYRLAPTPQSDEEILPGGRAPMPPTGAPGAAPGAGAPTNPMMIPLPPDAQPNAVADGLQAIKLVRSNAAKWGIAPDRVLFMGFSAGAALTAGTMLAENQAERPNYAGVIYGGPIGGPIPSIPANTPPAFLAVAGDDPLAGTAEIKFFEALREAKASPELHVYRSGQHGFSMQLRNGTSDHWIDELYWWMTSYGLTKP
jgi:acetyl esterase/lipase